jgi:transcriptional antiterminator RfaH
MSNWYCISTKPRCEAYICERFRTLIGVEVLNPMLKRNKFVRGRRHEIIEALFPGYIFVRFNPHMHYRMIRYTRGVRRILGDAAGNPYIMDEEIIDEMQSRLRDGYICMDTVGFDTGDSVVIQEGPLSGFRGIFLRDLHSRDRVLILLNTISYQVHIEIERSFLAKAGSQ